MMKHTVIFYSLVILLAAAIGAPLYAAKEKASSGGNETDYCVSCHEAEKSDRLKNPVTEWKKSVHGAAGQKCSRCHGGDPTVNDKVKAKSKAANFIGRPDKKTIPEFCGRADCHTLALEQFKLGPHYQTVKKSGEPGCTSCHGVHNIQRTSIDVITVESCVSCHPADYSKDIISVISGTDRNFTILNDNLKFIAEKQGEVKQLQERVNNARHLFHQFVHVFSKQEMGTTKKILEMEMQSLDSETKQKVASIKRLDVLYLAMLIFILSIVGGITIYSIIMYGKRRKE